MESLRMFLQLILISTVASLEAGTLINGLQPQFIEDLGEQMSATNVTYASEADEIDHLQTLAEADEYLTPEPEAEAELAEEMTDADADEHIYADDDDDFVALAEETEETDEEEEEEEEEADGTEAEETELTEEEEEEPLTDSEIDLLQTVAFAEPLTEEVQDDVDIDEEEEEEEEDEAETSETNFLEISRRKYIRRRVGKKSSKKDDAQSRVRCRRGEFLKFCFAKGSAEGVVISRNGRGCTAFNRYRGGGVVAVAICLRGNRRAMGVSSGKWKNKAVVRCPRGTRATSCGCWSAWKQCKRLTFAPKRNACSQTAKKGRGRRRIKVTALCTRRRSRRPTRPGCWVRLPSGCRNKKNKWQPRSKKRYQLDRWGMKNKNAGNNRRACYRRRNAYNKWCRVRNARIKFKATRKKRFCDHHRAGACHKVDVTKKGVSQRCFRTIARGLKRHGYSFIPKSFPMKACKCVKKKSKAKDICVKCQKAAGKWVDNNCAADRKERFCEHHRAGACHKVDVTKKGVSPKCFNAIAKGLKAHGYSFIPDSFPKKACGCVNKGSKAKTVCVKCQKAAGRWVDNNCAADRTERFCEHHRAGACHKVDVTKRGVSPKCFNTIMKGLKAHGYSFIPGSFPKKACGCVNGRSTAKTICVKCQKAAGRWVNKNCAKGRRVGG